MFYKNYLTTFICVAECESFRKAAEELYISPSAAVKQISTLEADLGVRVFERNNQGLILTGAGEFLLHDAKTLVQQCDAIVTKMQEIHNTENCRIRIGFSALMPADVLREYIPQIKKKLPGINIEFVQFGSDIAEAGTVHAHYKKGVDILVALYDDGLLSFFNNKALKIRKTSYMIGVPQGHRLSGKKQLKLSDLRGETLYLRSVEEHNCETDIFNFLAENEPEINIRMFPFYNFDIFNFCAESRQLLVGVDIWKGAHPLIDMVPINWSFTGNQGVLYSPTCSQEVKQFIDALTAVL